MTRIRPLAWVRHPCAHASSHPLERFAIPPRITRFPAPDSSHRPTCAWCNGEVGTTGRTRMHRSAPARQTLLPARYPKTLFSPAREQPRWFSRIKSQGPTRKHVELRISSRTQAATIGVAVAFAWALKGFAEMDEQGLDALLRAWQQARGTRRSVGRGATTTLLGAVFGSTALRDTTSARKKKHKKKRKGGAAPPCLPSCGANICGTDGCGGTCGSCELCNACQGGQCAPAASDPGCAGQCRACLEGLCIQNVNGASCTEVANGQCQAGVCVPAQI